MTVITLGLLIAGLILFVLAAWGVSSPRVNLMAAGLACWILTAILPALR